MILQQRVKALPLARITLLTWDFIFRVQHLAFLSWFSSKQATWDRTSGVSTRGQFLIYGNKIPKSLPPAACSEKSCNAWPTLLPSTPHWLHSPKTWYFESIFVHKTNLVLLCFIWAKADFLRYHHKRRMVWSKASYYCMELPVKTNVFEFLHFALLQLIWISILIWIFLISWQETANSIRIMGSWPLRSMRFHSSLLVKIINPFKFALSDVQFRISQTSKEEDWNYLLLLILKDHIQ